MTSTNAVAFDPGTRQFVPEQPNCERCGYKHPEWMWCENADKIRLTAHRMMGKIRKMILTGDVLQ